jgi:hypothetical protein
MAKNAYRPAETGPTPETLPQSGGSYVRTEAGELIPNIPPPQDAPPATAASAVAGEPIAAPIQE